MRGVPKETYGIAALVAAILAGVFLFTYSGPYRVVADLMVAWFNTNIVNLSFFVTMIILMVPLGGAVYALERRLGTRTTWFTPIWSNLDRSLDLPPGKLMMVGVICIVMGGYFAVRDLAIGPLVSLSVRDLEDDRVQRGTYVELVDGTVVEDANIRFRSNSTTWHYFPIVDHGDPPMLFVRVSERAQLRVPSGHIRGILEVNGIEGELQGRLRASNALGERHYVLGAGRVPSPTIGLAMAAIGLALTLMGMIWWRTRQGTPRPGAA